jgi:hypothetical protein
LSTPTPTPTPTLPVPPAIGRLERRALPAAAAGVLLLAAGFLADPVQAHRSYLFAWVFWCGVAVGCLSITMISHLTGGMWGLVIRRFLEAGARTLPVWALLFLPVAFGVRQLYTWAKPELVAADPLLQHKAVYLNVPFFLGRAAFYLAAWIVLAQLLSRWSAELDAAPSLRASRRLRALSGGGLVVLGLTITFSAFDWGMSLAPHWFSTIYGILFMVGQALSAIALMIVSLAWLAGERPVSDAVRPGLVHDLGKLLLAFTMLWAYVNFSQFLIIWSGNVAEATPFYVHRSQGGWQWVALALAVFHFALPFLLLLSRDLKRNARALGAVAAGMLLVRVLDLYWLMGPDLAGHGHHAVPFAPHWLDVAAPLGLGAVFVFFYARQLRSRPLLPTGEPEIAELLQPRAESR